MKKNHSTGAPYSSSASNIFLTEGKRDEVLPAEQGIKGWRLQLKSVEKIRICLQSDKKYPALYMKT
jgi:hypothetical protein